MRDAKTRNVKLFIFDWSGTISDDRIPFHTAFNRVAQELGLKLTENLGEFLKLTTHKRIEAELSKQLLKPKSPEEIWKLYVKHFSEVKKDGIIPTIYADVPDILEKIKKSGKKIIVVSSHPKKNLIEEAIDYGIADNFDKIIGDVINKTDGMIKACNEMFVDIKNAAYVGDMVGDIRAAKKAKAISVALTRGYHDKKNLLLEKPDYLLEKLSDLAKLL